MSIISIRLYGDSILRQKASAVKVIDKSIDLLAEDLIETMLSVKGLGLAAPQIGYCLSMVVVNLPALNLDEPPLILLNPQVISEQGEKVYEEGCLSLPGIFEEIKRAEKVVVWARNLKGEEFSLEGDGLLSRVLLHEIDHLNGVLFIDRISSLRRRLLRKKLKNLKRVEEKDEHIL
ncbi:MAG: peptide deformylase [Candidatus Edwardsbacteria bacterium]